jgi:hypothetical protein
MLVPGGDRDGTVSRQAILDTGRVYGAKTRLCPDTGHNLMLEETWERVAESMEPWMRKVILDG